MLNQVPTQINRSARIVTLRHPNSMDCTVWRKRINRTAPTQMGGLPTVGGVGVLDSEDEADYTYEEIGDAKVLFSGQFQTQGLNVRDNDTSLNYQDAPVEAQVECVLAPEHVDFFIVDKTDMVTVEPGAGIVLSYECLGETSSVNIPPYVRKIVLAPRQDSEVGV